MFRSSLFNLGRRQIHVVSAQTIKPSFPTPSHLKHYNLSPMDQFALPVYMPLIFHYPNNSNYRSSSRMQDVADKSRRLKTSLSEILMQYYPFAGRLSSTGSYVECNDEGIEFQEVSFECGLSEILGKPEHEACDLLYPKEGLVSKNNSTLLVVRVNHFECGGMSILVSMSHKLGDAGTFLTFMKSWARKTRRRTNNSNSNDQDDLPESTPHFISYPSSDDINSIVTAGLSEPPPLMKNHWVIRKFVFPNSKIAQLKATVDDPYNTTRVEALTSLLCKRATNINFDSSGFFTPTLLVHLVNMRRKLLPPLPETSIGNFLSSVNVPITNPSENNLNAIIKKIKKAKMDIGGMKILDPMVNASTLLEFQHKNYNFFVCSSICRMQFYQVDFGWGNPNRVTLADSMINNAFILMDTPNGDGIEALVALDEHNMVAFQDDEEILTFSS